MVDYNFKEGKKRIEEILDSPNQVEEGDDVPSETSFTYENGFKGWVTSIFVDIRNSTALFADPKQTRIAKIVRCFTSEIIEILNDGKLREIGIRGDCVYAIYTSSTHEMDHDIYLRAAYINTYLQMLNKVLEEKNFPTFQAGIGISTAKELVVKAGRRRSQVNNLVWIGEATSRAAKLSDKAKTEECLEAIAMSDSFFNSIIPLIRKSHPDEQVDQWFAAKEDENHNLYYGADIIMTDFNKWIENGFQD